MLPLGALVIALPDGVVEPPAVTSNEYGVLLGTPTLTLTPTEDTLVIPLDTVGNPTDVSYGGGGIGIDGGGIGTADGKRGGLNVGVV